MFYRAWIDTPNPQQETLELSDVRSPMEMGAALANDGYIVTKKGTSQSSWYSDGTTSGGTYEFTGTGRVVLLARHVIRLDETVMPPNTVVTES